MEIKKLVDTINRTYISSDYLRQPDIYYYMDRVIDDINENLQSSFPTFSEWETFVKEYNRQFEPIPPVPIEPDGVCPPEQPHEPGPSDLDDRPIPPRGRPLPPKRRVPPLHPHPYSHQELWAPDRPKDRTVYDAIPDKYLRSVVALGTALYYYEADEEGEQIAMDYQRRYEQQLFYMVRDYQMLVPPMYQNNFGGYIDFSHEREFGPPNLHPRGVVMRGYNSRIL